MMGNSTVRQSVIFGIDIVETFQEVSNYFITANFFF